MRRHFRIAKQYMLKLEELDPVIMGLGVYWNRPQRAKPVPKQKPEPLTLAARMLRDKQKVRRRNHVRHEAREISRNNYMKIP